MSSVQSMLRGSPSGPMSTNNMYGASFLPSPPEEPLKQLTTSEGSTNPSDPLRGRFFQLRKRLLTSELSKLKQKIAKQERQLCKNREKLAAYTKYFRTEREGMAKTWEHYVKIDARAVQALDELRSGSEAKLQDELIAMIGRLANKYPRYQIRSANSFGRAIDSAVSTIEVIMEDAEMLRLELAKVERDLRFEKHLQFEMKAKLSFLREVMVRQALTPPAESSYTRFQLTA